MGGRAAPPREPAPVEPRPDPAALGVGGPRDQADRRRSVVFLETAPQGAFEAASPPRSPRGESRSVRFDRPGVVRVFCEIHSHMSAFVIVFAHGFFTITDADGRYRIEGIPPGSYSLAVWHQGEVRQRRTVDVPETGGAVELDFEL